MLKVLKVMVTTVSTIRVHRIFLRLLLGGGRYVPSPKSPLRQNEQVQHDGRSHCHTIANIIRCKNIDIVNIPRDRVLPPLRSLDSPSFIGAETCSTRLTFKPVAAKIERFQSVQVPQLGGYFAWQWRFGGNGKKGDSSGILDM